MPVHICDTKLISSVTTVLVVTTYIYYHNISSHTHCLAAFVTSWSYTKRHHNSTAALPEIYF